MPKINEDNCLKADYSGSFGNKVYLIQNTAIRFRSKVAL